MKPFEVGKTYKDKKGRDVRVICVDRKSPNGLCLVGLVNGNFSDKEAIDTYTTDGTWGSSTSEYDLIPEKDVREFWIAIYPNGARTRATYSSEEEAKAAHAWAGRYEKYTYEA